VEEIPFDGTSLEKRPLVLGQQVEPGREQPVQGGRE
jgi:hypothetical protein